MKIPYKSLIGLFILATEFVFAQSGTLLIGQTTTIGNVTREYNLFLPSVPQNAPIVFLFHGHSNTSNGLIGLDENGVNDPSSVAPYRPWLDIAEQEDIILVIPDGYNIGDTIKGWNDCRSDGVGNSEQDDVLFVSTLIDDMVSSYQADPNRVYANGTSNGGHFCIRLAEEIPEKIAAFAAVVSSNAANSECVTGNLPVSALFINGTADPLCPYEGGEMPDNRGEVVSTDSTIAYWIQRNEAITTAVITSVPNTFSSDNCTVTKYEYSPGSTPACVTLLKVNNGGHTDPSPTERYAFPAVPIIFGRQNGDIQMAQEAWNFFQNKTNLTVAIQETDKKDPMVIYPNPATDFCTLNRTDWSELNEIELLNAMGRTVRTFDSNSLSFDLRGIASGVYFLKVDKGGTTLIEKVIKK